MKSSFPIWALPLVLALLGIVILVGNLGTAVRIAVSAEVLLFCGYIVYRQRRTDETAATVSSLVSLFPGHLLLLLAISTLDRPDPLAALWLAVPAATIAHDAAIRWKSARKRVRLSILVGLYAIIWADLFVLLERTIAVKRQFSLVEELIIAAAFVVVGSLFIGLGIYRHWLSVKE
jgi:hypothetical protein